MPAKPKAPRPTHFVCFPLVTESSTPQLAESLAYFRSVTVPPENGGEDQSTRNAAVNEGSDSRLRLIPAGAHRPPGTFHLTLGTMDLTAPEDMERALKLLQDTDYLELLHEAGRGMTAHPTHKIYSEVEQTAREGDQNQAETTSRSPAAPLESLSRAISPPPPNKSSLKDVPSAPTSLDTPQHHHSPTSISVTLSGLGTFPRASSARIFYAHPHDSTSRLLPFANSIRERFREVKLVTDTRPLVLHATVANFIYDKQRRKRRFKGPQDSGMSVDARDLLMYFNDGRATRDRARAKTAASEASHLTTATDQDESTVTLPSAGSEGHAPESEVVGGTAASKFKSEDNPAAASRGEYVWARDIVIDRIRICKMGAQKSDVEGWGLEYVPIAEKVFAS